MEVGSRENHRSTLPESRAPAWFSGPVESSSEFGRSGSDVQTGKYVITILKKTPAPTIVVMKTVI